MEQMKQMIRDEIHSISNLEERIVFKALMEGVFLTLYETNEQMYQDLENRVMNDLSYNVNRYLIKTGLVERSHLDMTHPFMTVMKAEDATSLPRRVSEIRAAIKQEGRCYLSTVFLQCDLLEIQNILQEKETCFGEVFTTAAYPVKVQLEQNSNYLKEIEYLYHLFMKNEISWQTVNAPYLFKLVDVYITAIPADCRDHDEIEKFNIDLGEYIPYIHYDMVPIWNVWFPCQK